MRISSPVIPLCGSDQDSVAAQVREHGDKRSGRRRIKMGAECARVRRQADERPRLQCHALKRITQRRCRKRGTFPVECPPRERLQTCSEPCANPRLRLQRIEHRFDGQRAIAIRNPNADASSGKAGNMSAPTKSRLHTPLPRLAGSARSVRSSKANRARPFAHPSPICSEALLAGSAVFDDLAELALNPDAKVAELRERHDRDDGLRIFQRPPAISPASRRDKGA